MTFDEFRVDFFKFLGGSNVNLGRTTSKTRQVFINEAIAKFDAFVSDPIDKKPASNNENKSILCIKPSDRNKALDIGKGVHAMTPGESMRADQQLNRSPFVNETEKKDLKNE